MEKSKDWSISNEWDNNEESKILTNRAVSNPAIFVPELKKIVWGMESYWREIKSADDFKGINREDIESQ